LGLEWASVQGKDLEREMEPARVWVKVLEKETVSVKALVLVTPKLKLEWPTEENRNRRSSY
jgi:hypothetical protein